MQKWRLLLRTIFFSLLFFSSFVVPLYASNETISPDCWIYPALRTFELLGMVHLRPTIPYTRSEVECYLDKILYNLENKPECISERQSYLLEKLKREFQDKANRPEERENTPVFYLKEGRRFVAMDMSAAMAFLKEIDEEKGEVNGIFQPNVIVDLGDNITLETGYFLRMAPEKGSNVRNMKPSPRVTSFRGVTSEYRLGYLNYSGELLNVKLGRDYIHWGNNGNEGLLFSRTAGSIDQLSFDFSISRFKLSGIHAILDSELPRRLAAHRLTIRLPHGIYVGIGEVVVYVNRSFDFTYLMPVSSFYANKFNEEEDDNILWGIDFKLPIRKRVLIYGEILIDDFQYEDDPPAPHKVGLNITSQAIFQVGEMDMELSAGYTYLDIFTYSHKDSALTCYVVGKGDPKVDALLGSPLGPDADRWDFQLLTSVHPRVQIRMGGSYTRRGEGNELRDWDRVEDPDPPFPSGDVSKETVFVLGGDVDLGGGSMVSAAGGLRYISHSDADMDEREEFAYLQVTLDF
jgi:hypothetical protein